MKRADSQGINGYEFADGGVGAPDTAGIPTYASATEYKKAVPMVDKAFDLGSEFVVGLVVVVFCSLLALLLVVSFTPVILSAAVSLLTCFVLCFLDLNSWHPSVHLPMRDRS